MYGTAARGTTGIETSSAPTGERQSAWSVVRPGGSRGLPRVVLALKAALLLLIAFPGAAAAETVPPEIPDSSAPADAKWLPAFDYDGDGCYPSVAIGRNGTLNPGLNNSGALDGQCHDPSDLDNSNVYARAKRNNGWQAYLYDMYFQKDQAVPGVDAFGHRHDIEHVVVWVHDGSARYVSTSAHGEYNTHAASAAGWHEGTHAKVVYHKDGAGTHAFRLAGKDEQPENDWGSWHYPTLVSWNNFPGDTRAKLTGADFSSASLAIKDGAFQDNLDKAKPDGIPFDPYA
ncbi:NPP1 family protein [Actinopolyspora saharensis]|uniref:NPP1 family protein n=1 Tax=Actinopolyspora saharensis TaxID=995062 RepID=UPI003F676316